MTTCSRRITMVSPQLWKLRDVIAQRSTLEPVMPWQVSRLSGEKAYWTSELSPIPRKHVEIGPGIIWSLSPRHQKLPFGLRIKANDNANHRSSLPSSADRSRLTHCLEGLVEKRLWSRADLPDHPLAADVAPELLVALDLKGRRDRLEKCLDAPLRDSVRRERAFFYTRDHRVFQLQEAANGQVGPDRDRAAQTSSPWPLFDSVKRVVTDWPDLAILAHAKGLQVYWHPRETAQPTQLPFDPKTLYADLFEDSLYFDPWRRTPVSLETAIDQAAWLRDRMAENPPTMVFLGISRWKRANIARFFEGRGHRAEFVKSSSDRAIKHAKARDCPIVTWETRKPADLEGKAKAARIPVLRIEDGFLRSVGLGAGLVPGASIVADDIGIYYDGASPSKLEGLLAKSEFTPGLIARARTLREAIVSMRLSKYNVGDASERLELPNDRPIVLVPGQVEDDASVQRGSSEIRSNLSLLAKARELHPAAFIVFKPHPDVEAGLRSGHVDEGEARNYADLVIRRTPIVDLLDHVTHVTTMTSLTGFEALLRGKAVTTIGLPFYAGWGLTDDHIVCERRNRRLSLDELVAGALILYPRYIDPVTGLRCEPELLIKRLAAQRECGATPIRSRPLGRMWSAMRLRALRLITPPGKREAVR